MRQITIEATVCESLEDAIQHADASGHEPIQLDGRSMVTTKREIERLETAGVAFYHLTTHKDSSGRECVMTVPVN